MAFFILLIIILLSQTHERLSIEESLKNVQDLELKKCISSSAKTDKVDFVYQLTKLDCKLNYNAQKEPVYIRSLAGLEQFAYLRHITFSNLQINSIPDLSNLTKLKSFSAANSGLFRVEELGKLNLRYLDLSANKIQNPSALGQISNLIYLNLENNLIESIDFINSLKNLRYLNLRSNLIKDFKLDEDFKQLLKLNLSSNQIEDISGFNALEGLETLILSDNKIVEVSALSSLEKLKELDLSRNKIKDVSSLSYLTPHRMILEGNSLEIGIEDLYLELAKKPIDFEVLINLNLNNKIPCEALRDLRNRLSSRIDADIIEPKSCSSDYKHGKKKHKHFLFW